MVSTTGRLLVSGVVVTALTGLVAATYQHKDGARTGSDSQCTTCHVIEPVLSHPVGVVPSMPIPPDLRLIDGRIGCVTCHDITSNGRPGIVTDCYRCHDTRRESRDFHVAAAGRAHLVQRPHPADDGTAFRSLGPDPESQRCLSCHDGTVAPGGGGRYEPGGPPSLERITTRHPLGSEQYPRGPGDHLVPPDQVDPRIRLYDGRVGCGSCHSPFGLGDALLVMSNQRSALCLSCHDF